MSSHDLTIDNGAGQVVRLDLQAALQALATCSSGTSAPSPTYANMYWLDTSGSPLVLKQRNNTNSGWYTVATISGDTIIPYRAAKAIDEVATAKSNLTAVTNPAVTDDANAGYSKGSRWLNTATNEIFECASPTNGAAVWKSLSAQVSVVGIRFTTTPDVDPSGSGADSIAIGDGAATGTANTALAIGKDARVVDGSTGSIGIGLNAGTGNPASGGNYNTFVGAHAARAVVGTATFGGSNLVMGAYALHAVTSGNLSLGASCVVLAPGGGYSDAGTIVNDGAILIGGNCARASAAGGTVTAEANALVIGREACRNTNASAALLIAQQSISIGYRANYNAAPGASATALGAQAAATGAGSLALGVSADATGPYAIAIGGGDTDATSADASGTNAIAIGYNAAATAATAVAIGPNVESTLADTLAIGTSNTNKLTLDASGHIRTTAALDALVVDSAIADDISGIRSRAYRPHLTLEDVSTGTTDFQIWADGGKLSILSGDASAPGKLAETELTVDPANGTIDAGANRLVNAADPVNAQDLVTRAYVDPIHIGTFVEGKPAGGEGILRMVAARAFTLPAGLAGSQFKAGIAATGQAVFAIRKNGSEVGTATVAASGTTASFAAASPAGFAIGDVLTISAPAAADATLADLAITLVASRA